VGIECLPGAPQAAGQDDVVTLLKHWQHDPGDRLKRGNGWAQAASKCLGRLSVGIVITRTQRQQEGGVEYQLRRQRDCRVSQVAQRHHRVS
jgi:hypothetical protein